MIKLIVVALMLSGCLQVPQTKQLEFEGKDWVYYVDHYYERPTYCKYDPPENSYLQIVECECDKYSVIYIKNGVKFEDIDWTCRICQSHNGVIHEYEYLE